MLYKYITNGDSILTRVIIEQYDRRYVVESPYSDDDTIKGLLRLISAVAVASSWDVGIIADKMHEYANEIGDVEWEPVEEELPDIGPDYRWEKVATDGLYPDRRYVQDSTLDE